MAKDEFFHENMLGHLNNLKKTKVTPIPSCHTSDKLENG